MQILTLRAWSNAFDFEKLLHTRETQLMICTASCALSHGGLAGSTALTQTCAAGDSGFFPTLSLSHTTTMRPLLTPSPHRTGKKKSPKFSLESLTSRMRAGRSVRLHSEIKKDFLVLCSWMPAVCRGMVPWWVLWKQGCFFNSEGTLDTRGLKLQHLSCPLVADCCSTTSPSLYSLETERTISLFTI